MSEANSKTFGFPDNSQLIDPDQSLFDSESSKQAGNETRFIDDRISSNMALDRYQAMFAIATHNGAIKIFNLKGYEQDIPSAHQHPIQFLLFVPNRGKLMSIDT